MGFNTSGVFLEAGAFLLPDNTLPESAYDGRAISPTPASLSHRVLYIPEHNGKVTTHLPIYDCTTQYNDKIGNEPIGSGRFKTRLGIMKKPTGDGREDGSAVQYLVDFDEPLARANTRELARKKSVDGSPAVPRKGTISRRALGSGAIDVELDLPAGAEEHFAIKVPSQAAPIPVHLNFFIPTSVTRIGSFKNPWFTFTVPSVFDDDSVYQWQIQPVGHGMLRYTLVEQVKAQVKTDAEHSVPRLASAVDHPENIRAIYHNIGVGYSLKQQYSEGVLLLPQNIAPELEAIILSSLLGLLWQARRMEAPPPLGSSVSKHFRKGSTAASSETGKTSEEEVRRSAEAGKQSIEGSAARQDGPVKKEGFLKKFFKPPPQRPQKKGDNAFQWGLNV